MISINTSDSTLFSDHLSETPDSVKTKVATAEQEMLLQYSLGLDFRDVHNTNPDAAAIATKVVQKVAQSMDGTRNAISQIDLQRELQQNISASLASVSIYGREASRFRGQRLAAKDHTDQLGHRRIRAVTEAIYNTLSKEAVDSLIRYAMPIALQTGVTVNRHKLFLKARVDQNGNLITAPGTGDNIVIDTRTKFWVENGPFATARELATALEGKNFTYCGIESSHTNTFASAKISRALALAIAGSNINSIRLSNKYQTRLERIDLAAGGNAECSIDLNALVSAEIRDEMTRIDPGFVYPRYIGEFDLAQLTRAFSFPVIFNRYIHGINEPITMMGSHNAIGGPYPINELLARLTFERIQGAGYSAAGPLAEEVLTVFEIQRELREQHHFHTRLREGSENNAGAAFASSLLMRYKDLGDVLDGSDRAKVQEDYDKVDAKINLGSYIENAEKLTLQAQRSWHDNLAIETLLPAERSKCRPSATVDIHINLGFGLVYDVIAPVSQADARAAEAFVAEQAKRVREEINEFQKAEGVLRNTALAVANIKNTHTAPPNILSLFTISATKPYTITGPNHGNFSRNNILQYIAELKSDTDLILTDEDKEKKEKLAKQLKDMREGKSIGLSGPEAQHAVIVKYFEQYQGCTPSEAKAAANYMLARTKLDADMVEMTDMISGDLYGDTQESNASWADWRENLTSTLSLDVETHEFNVINEVAKACRIPTNGTFMGLHLNQPSWANVRDHRNLVTAYFTLKELSEGKGTEAIQLKGSRFFQQSMKEISRLLMKNHSVKILRDINASLNISDEKMKEMLKEPSKMELAKTLEEFLAGDTPLKYRSRVDQVMAKADGNVEWKRRTLKWAAKGTATGIGKVVGGGAKKGYSAGKVVATKGAGAVKTVAYDAPKKIVYDAPKAVAGGVWRNKGAIATIGGLSILGGPVAGVGAWYLYKQFSKSSK